jgi:undecaprenyl-diphosphatase
MLTAPRRALGRFTERSVLGLLLVLALGVAFGLLLLLVRAEWAPLHALDHDAAADLNTVVSRHEPVAATLRALSELGNRLLMAGLVGVVAAALLIRRERRLALYLTATGVGALLLDPSLKALVGRLRPVVDVPVSSAPGASFPSGHALGTIVAYGAVLLVLLPALRPARRRIAVASWATLVVLVGLTRIALGVHYISDVLGGWLLGLAWLGVTAHAFRLWQRDRGRPTPPVTDGLDPSAAPALIPALDERHLPPHPWAAAARLLTGWVLVFGTLYATGTLLTRDTAPLAAADRAVWEWFAAHRTPALDRLSDLWSQAGDTTVLLPVALVTAPLMVAAWRRWRPVLFIALAMAGELTLFLASAAAVGRPRPPVENLDGTMPTSSFPSGHIAATLCLWAAIALLVQPRVRAWWRWIPVTLAVLMPAGVALSRLYRGMHHLTDALGALLLATLWLTLLYLTTKPNADVAAAPGS